MPEMTPDDAALRTAMHDVIEPDTGLTLAAARAIKAVRVEAGRIHVALELGHAARSGHEALARAVTHALATVAGDMPVDVVITTRVLAHAVQRGVPLLPDVKNVIAVASGKGGVGKSTTTVNLALALAAEGATVGILDADIYGPSLPMMMGLSGRPESADGKMMEPLENYGVQVMSIGFLIEADNPMIWRGPMATQALDQLLRQTRWRALDYLLVDMPPGTGDIALTLSQRVPLTGAVIVTTPQDIALLDAKKGLKMFEKVAVPILGVVENMAVYCCPNCGHVEHIFGADGGLRLAAEHSVEVLGSLPLSLAIREQSDAGRPTVVADAQGDVAMMYRRMARRLGATVAMKARDFSAKFPTITISKAT